MTVRNQANYYEILEIPMDLPQSEIHKAYLRAKSTYSQDNPALYTMFTKEEARELAQMIEEAYSVLGQPVTRQSYDRTLQAQLGPIATPNYAPSIALSQQPSVVTQTPPPVIHEVVPEIPKSQSMDLDQAFTVRKREPTKDATPEGMGRTPYSTYSLNEGIEAEIRSVTDVSGDFLKRIRSYKGLSLEKMSEATRISKSYLSAIESEDCSSLPAPVFVRGFVVQICRILGLDDTKHVSSYMTRFKAHLEKRS